ncbi:alpha/beta hydrolase [Muricoccus aerilatus]|uniref:alpha/beta hydrolase n=1 Tax=Muricoccus aerilatus TaxID=452982 RepID=UPI00146FD8E9|nr:alpha/beta fold hydrolase [Roseomonas aerilata]
MVSVVGLLALVWLLAVALLWWFQERVMFPAGGGVLGDPSPGSHFSAHVVRNADELQLRFWAAEPQAGMPVILYLHGNGGHAGHREKALRPFTAAGYGVVLAEYRGYGGNPGLPTEKGLITDARAQADWAVARWPDAPFVLWGESIGTGVAVTLAAERQFAGVILDSPFTSVRQIAASAFRWAPVRLLLRHPFDSLARLPEVRAPVFVLHGERDGIVPVEQGRRMLAEAPCPAGGAFLPGVGHPALLADQGTAARQAALGFLARLRQQEITCPNLQLPTR